MLFNRFLHQLNCKDSRPTILRNAVFALSLQYNSFVDARTCWIFHSGLMREIYWLSKEILSTWNQKQGYSIAVRTIQLDKTLSLIFCTNPISSLMPTLHIQATYQITCQTWSRSIYVLTDKAKAGMIQVSYSRPIPISGVVVCTLETDTSRSASQYNWFQIQVIMCRLVRVFCSQAPKDDRYLQDQK